ncbi:MAG: DNA mismatch repair endonuclease MutL [Deltaproteobacteria bacterium]|nr:DNA mismatch repair endonuclease MutL [Deltaproteobacteria bacterium]
MSRIRILPEILSNKIAAGEVVERPASVVKELIENSLDAGSTRIVVEVEKGGRSLIRVSDNGSGMSRDDALLSIERYATSKLYSDSDLFAIDTLGFRGEALPSIASVSKLTLVTREEAAECGTEIVLEGGKLLKVLETGSPIGTQVTVKHLFFNTPVRQKFLKTIPTEMGHISDVISNMALGWPKIHFKLIHNGSILQNWSAAADPASRITDILGKDFGSGLFPVKTDFHEKIENDGVSLSGWMSLPRITRATSQGIFVFVNGRMVRSRMVQHALIQAYGGRLMKGQFPLAVLFITVPCDQVDVNVHPSKQEIRFSRQQDIYDAIVAAVSAGLSHEEKPSWTPSKPQGPTAISEEPVRAEKKYPYIIPASDNRAPATVADLKSDRASASAQTPDPPVPFRPLRPKDQPQLWETPQSVNLNPIGQFFDSYIICESGENLILLDQHAAHERILYEKLADKSVERRIPIQRLLIPETLDIGYRQALILEKLIPDLCQYGFEIELFGKDSFVIKSVPMILSGREIKPLVIEMVDRIMETGLTANLEKSLDACLKLMACHGAIRANQSLTLAEMATVIKDLEACRIPAHCPHGRPTWIQWPRQEIERLFKRT